MHKFLYVIIRLVSQQLPLRRYKKFNNKGNADKFHKLSTFPHVNVYTFSFIIIQNLCIKALLGIKVDKLSTFPHFYFAKFKNSVLF